MTDLSYMTLDEMRSLKSTKSQVTPEVVLLAEIVEILRGVRLDLDDIYSAVKGNDG